MNTNSNSENLLLPLQNFNEFVYVRAFSDKMTCMEIVSRGRGVPSKRGAGRARFWYGSRECEGSRERFGENNEEKEKSEGREGGVL